MALRSIIVFYPLRQVACQSALSGTSAHEGTCPSIFLLVYIFLWPSLLAQTTKCIVLLLLRLRVAMETRNGSIH